MLTQHLYRVDEVCAALKWAVLTGRTVETLFWAVELDEAALRTTLTRIWELFFCLHLTVGEQIRNADVATLQTIAVAFAARTYTTDSTALCLLRLGAGIEHEIDRTTVAAPGATREERAFRAACRQGKSLYAWTVARASWPGAWDWVVPDARWMDNTWMSRAIAVAATCFPVRPTVAARPAWVDERLAEWSTLSPRKRRVYRIPWECLYGETERGRLRTNETTDSELTTNFETALADSPFGAPPLEDEAREAYFDTHFPDDIPDEWSRADREKSHGSGSLMKTESFDDAKYMRRWFTRASSRMWRGVADMFTCGAEWERIYDERVAIWAEQQRAWKLTPVRKRIVIEGSTGSAAAAAVREDAQGSKLHQSR